MKQKVKTYIKNNLSNTSFLFQIYNYFFGKNRIKISSKNSTEIGAVLMKKTKILVNGFNNTIIIKNLSKLINCNIYVSGNNNHIVISEGVYLNHTELWIEDDNNKISIGKHTSIDRNTQLAAIEGTSINIGNDCMFSSNIHFRTGDSHSILDSTGKRINISEDIIIGNHVWIGTQVMCLKGAIIADNCIVGAGSLVTKKFTEKNLILAGTPAQVIKSEVEWLRERI